MSSVVRPPDPCLVAIALVVSSRAGPHFVFHFPPSPSIANSTHRQDTHDEDAEGAVKPADSSSAHREEDEEEEEEGLSSDDEDTLEPVGEEGGNGSEQKAWNNNGIRRSPSRNHGVGGLMAQKKTFPSADVDPADSIHEDKASGRPGSFQWDSFLGLKCDVWEKLLSPSPSWHKRRFEVGVNDLTLVGWPVFVRKDGSWRKRKKGTVFNEPDDVEGAEPGKGEEALFGGGNSQPQTPNAGEKDKLSNDTRADTPSGDRNRNEASSEDSSAENKDDMTMFNVVFVLNPPTLESNVRVKEVYENVIKKFGKALKSEQKGANYVSNEARTILQIKEDCREKGCSLSSLYTELCSKSSLARAMATIYNNISASKIASITLSPQSTMSMQIPPLTSTPYAPSPNEPGYPGLWLTTADSLSAADETFTTEPSGPSKVLAKHFTLLLLNDEGTILKDIEASMSSIGPPLAHYIRSSKPTKSFAQISARSQIPLSDIQVLASHLVYWRRARAIPPLSKQNTYIVSANADMTKLRQATAAYEATFPTLPSLPKMLAALSGTPRPYFSFIPSKDHKDVYYEILAWLLRGGWVTQLRTFGWVKVNPEVKRAVREAILEEEKRGKSQESRAPSITDYSQKSSGDHNHRDAGESIYSSSSSSLDSENSRDTTGISVTGNYNTLHDNGSNNALMTSSLILRPHRASPLESRWLDQIMARFPTTSPDIDTDQAEVDAAVRKYWPMFTKYFNGNDALQKVAVREGLNRKLVWKFLADIDVNTMPSSKVADPRKKVLLTVRHW